MGILLLGLTAMAAISLLVFSIAVFLDWKHRKQEQRDFLTGIIRRAVFHTASLPNGTRKFRHDRRFTNLPLLTYRTNRLLEDSGC